MNRVDRRRCTRSMWQAAGLADYGKPGNYFERQIGRWGKQYLASVTHADRGHGPADRMAAGAHAGERARRIEGLCRSRRLPARQPGVPCRPSRACWPCSTGSCPRIGHPLADFSYHCMAWHIPPGAFRGIGGLDHAALGIPGRVAVTLRRYCERTGFTTPAALARKTGTSISPTTCSAWRRSCKASPSGSRTARRPANKRKPGRRAGARPLAELGWSIRPTRLKRVCNSHASETAPNGLLLLRQRQTPCASASSAFMAEHVYPAEAEHSGPKNSTPTRQAGRALDAA